ncbi:MAG TPA: cytochrome c oxidase subunit 4 [Acidimicrobiales bacterium]|nr:cytochrome c oxidase subunit 4 [Acidimicrobiales bacterium]
MRREAQLLIGVAVFFAITNLVYWLWGIAEGGPTNPATGFGGITMLVGTILLGFVPGSYYYWWSRRMKPRPEDRSDATIAEGSGTIATFPDSSVWPFVLGMGLLLVMLSIVFGLWLMWPGLALVVSAAVGVTVESRRGGTV